MEFCEKHDMKLLVIDSSAQDQAVYDAIIKLVGKESPRLWTSGSRRSSNGAGDWIWMTTGNKLGFTNWGTGQPSSSGVGAAQQCIQLLPNYFSKGYWDDCECYELRTPVCMSTDH
ncbi:unnamed protein product [Psylliodes chrysocephalus]|uniref:C-type lectin domain-containing protein n=1 Tax=Psylliodes chrysocephalus TaxID=3402493 RepID=A0A9P0D3T6_9CUCU|nr:unnamed protein product [Psylliodes chrysocephala]